MTSRGRPGGGRGVALAALVLVLIVGSAPIATVSASPSDPFDATDTRAERSVPGPPLDIDGGGAVCAIEADGSLACWGDNSAGRAEPPDGTFESVVMGTNHGCAIDDSGAVLCWGENGYGEGGPLPGAYVAVSAGYQVTCAIDTALALECWGPWYFGKANPPPGTFTAVSSGYDHSCAIRTDESLACWGLNSSGQASPPSGSFSAVAAGRTHTCALRTTGKAVCWGSENYKPTGTYRQIDSYGSATCLIRTDSTLHCFGLNKPVPAGLFSDLGMPCAVRTDRQLVCWASFPPDRTLASLVAVDSGVCGLDHDDTLQCRSSLSYNGNDPPGDAFTAADFAWDHGCGVRSDQTLACWGRNLHGQATPPGGQFVDVSVDGEHSCGVRTDQTLACWGKNYTGDGAPPTGTFISVATGTPDCALRTDQSIICFGDGSGLVPPTGTFTQLVANREGACALSTDQTVQCWWGSGAPAPGPEGTFRSISKGQTGWSGYDNFGWGCGIRTDDTLACWGNDLAEEQPPPGGSYLSVSAGDHSACAIRVDGLLQCWGRTAVNGGPFEAPSATDCDPGGPGVFPDVVAGQPFCTDILWLVTDGIAWGYDDGDFRPGTGVTRAAMAAFMFRQADPKPFVPSTVPTFMDVPANHPFYLEIEWLEASGNANGFPDGTFRPNAGVTRQALAAFLFRQAEVAYSPPSTPTYSDVPTDHPFYKAIEWLSAVGVADGFPDGTFRPTRDVTRQAMGAFLHRFEDLGF